MKKKKVSEFESKRLMRLYIPAKKVRMYWYLFDAFATAPKGADHMELYDFLKFLSRCFDGLDVKDWGYDCDDIFTPYIYKMDEGDV